MTRCTPVPRAFAFAAALVVVAGCERLTESPARADLAATLSGASVRPDAVQEAGTGALEASVWSDNEFVFSLTFAGLAGSSTTAHLHGPADTNATGDVLLDLAALPAGGTGTGTLGGVSGSVTGALNLALLATSEIGADSIFRLLVLRRVYVDVHTDAHPDGEIRGQVVRR